MPKPSLTALPRPGKVHMLRAAAALGGSVAGLVAAAAAMWVPLPPSAQRAWGEALGVIAHPAAVTLAAMTGQPMQGEMSIVFHLVGIFATFAVAGAVIGWIVAWSLARREGPRA